MAEKQAKMGEKQESMAETNQKWQKTDKNDRKTFKMLSITNYHPPSFPFLSCQDSISVHGRLKHLKLETCCASTASTDFV